MLLCQFSCQGERKLFSFHMIKLVQSSYFRPAANFLARRLTRVRIETNRVVEWDWWWAGKSSGIPWVVSLVQPRFFPISKLPLFLSRLSPQVSDSATDHFSSILFLIPTDKLSQGDRPTPTKQVNHNSKSCLENNLSVPLVQHFSSVPLG